MSNTWKEKRLDVIAQQKRGITYKGDDLVDFGGQPYINMKSFKRGGGFNPDGLKFYNGAYQDSDILSENDLPIVNTDVTDGEIIGLPLLIPEFLKTQAILHSHHVTALRLDRNEILPEYLYRMLCLPKYRKEFRKYSRGTTVLMLDPKGIKNIVLSYPDKIEEQKKIIEILDLVDRAIAQTEALIAKHQRIKTGLMQDLLTCGIDEHGQLRDPSTHRFKSTPLGMIPAEWEVSNIGKISHRVTSGSRWWARYYSDTGAKFIRIGNLTREHVNLRLQNIQHVQPPDSSEAKRTVLETGDLLISVTADLGIIGIVPNDLGEAYINQHIALVKLNKEKVNPYFIGNLLSGFQAQKYFSLLNDSGAKAGLNLKTISAFPVVFPSDKDEQDRIAEIIQKTDSIIETQKFERKKLLGVKAGLMQDLLSGRVSVKGLVEG